MNYLLYQVPQEDDRSVVVRLIVIGLSIFATALIFWYRKKIKR